MTSLSYKQHPPKVFNSTSLHHRVHDTLMVPNPTNIVPRCSSVSPLWEENAAPNPDVIIIRLDVQTNLFRF